MLTIANVGEIVHARGTFMYDIRLNGTLLGTIHHNKKDPASVLLEKALIAVKAYESKN